ncbi:MAG: tetratricopeptide repeat protein [Limnospira sp. PMC 737.11]|uniref:Tetratricopeptide repeat protein n=1 Tax=Limnospira fusiformis PMC 851.14 TaxID=2219512 RepID=A0ABU9EK74_LIMFS|nr:tetratricopeptide repeat protein [Limnospira sp. PMC 737.11]MDT9272975.1 tetratricopeptide repeat protein [Limnospira sp. PMC 737.11]
MDIEVALKFIEDLLVIKSARKLTEDEKAILKGTWDDLTLDQIPGKYSLQNVADIRKTASKLWKDISTVFEPPIKVTKPKLKGIVEQQWRLRQEPETPEIDRLTDRDFVGREEAIADLDRLVERGATCILIQSPGGVGKTVLAERYLSERFNQPLLRFDIAKDTQNINSAEGWIEQNLRKLGEEPGREFLVSCDRLRTKLQSDAIAILIDNLEPALDKNGKLIDNHRSYVELLRVLCDPSLKSLTLITSRERVCENLEITLYPLKVLTVEAWREYFSQEGLNADSPVLALIHKAYGGNALAMNILRERIALDYQGDIEDYWEFHYTEEGVSVERAVQNLLVEQFSRLESVDMTAYQLLCRMGCFRYQDVPTVPRNGLLCLLWDVPKKEALGAIERLWNRGLIERVNREYKLHPLIRQEAFERLKISQDWEKTNRTAAEFWTDSVEIIDNTEDADKAIESVFHYLEINDYKKSAEMICQRRHYKYSQQLVRGISLGATLGGSVIRLGIYQKIHSLIDMTIVNLERNYFSSKLYNLLGDIHGIKGNINTAILCHFKSGDIASYLLNLESHGSGLDEINKYYLLEVRLHSILCIFNIGLCKIDIGEFDEGLKYLNAVISKTKHSDLFSSYSMRALYSLSSLLAFLGNKKQAKELVLIVEENLKNIKLGVRSTAYRLYNLGKAFRYLTELEKSFNYYMQAIEYCQKINFLQGNALALMGLAELYRIQNDIESALSYHHESIQILEKIGAKCDLAEAYYQLGLSYQAMGEIANSLDYFNRAIALWQQIDAPKQIERVQNSINEIN